MAKPKKLRDAYMKDPKARAFLEKHPEFDNYALEQVEVKQYGHTMVENRAETLYEPRDDYKDFGDHMLDAVRNMAEGPAKVLLNMYYNGATNAQMAKRLKIKKRSILDNRLVRAKRSALRQIKKAPRAIIFDQTPLATKVFTHNDSVKFIYLVKDELTNENRWVDERGIPFPSHIQEILNTNEEFSEWEDLVI